MADDFDQQFVDVDFEKQSPYIFGSIEPNLFAFSSYETKVPLLTDTEIEEAIDRIEDEDSGADQLVTRIFDQKSEGSCVSQACAQALQIIHAKEYGKGDVVQLSAMSLYKLPGVGRSPSSGATVSSGIEQMAKTGLLPLDTPENRERFGAHIMENTGFYQKFPPDCKLTSKRFRADEYHIATSTRAIWTALANRDPVIVGRQGHAIAYVKPTRNKGQWAAMYANSWSTRWGGPAAGFSGGFGYDTKRQVEMSANWAVVLRSAVDRQI